ASRAGNPQEAFGSRCSLRLWHDCCVLEEETGRMSQEHEGPCKILGRKEDFRWQIQLIPCRAKKNPARRWEVTFDTGRKMRQGASGSSQNKHHPKHATREERRPLPVLMGSRMTSRQMTRKPNKA